MHWKDAHVQHVWIGYEQLRALPHFAAGALGSRGGETTGGAAIAGESRADDSDKARVSH